MPGFWTTSHDGTPFHVNGDPDMPEETVEALRELMTAIAHSNAAQNEYELCPDCMGDRIIITCCDDLCVGQGWCMHGDGEEVCATCAGEGWVKRPESEGL